MSRVFVLGAGSSKAVIKSAPLNNQLLPEALKLTQDERIEDLRRFLGDFYPDTTTPPLEDVLTQLDICITEKHPISEKYNLTNLVHLRETLVYAICQVLAKALNSSKPKPIELMENFLHHIVEINDTIVSLNYDLIVDNTMWGKDSFADYSFKVRNYLEWDEQGWQNVDGYKDFSRSDPDKGWNLLKLHGSLNWLYCPACRAIDVTPGVKGVVYIFSAGESSESTTCHTCGVGYAPYIVTPTFLKNYGDVYLGQIWQHAEEKLSQAEEIIFIGYSLPDADIILRSMLTRAVYRNRQLRTRNSGNESSSVKITVVELGSDAKTRYQNLFGKKIEYIDQGFEWYVKNKMPNKASTP